MTENEAKALRWMKCVRDNAVVTLDHIEKNEPNVSPMLYAGRKEKAETIIKAFEELEQYRVLGTVERFQQLAEQFKPHVTDKTSCPARRCNKCDKYRKENEMYHEIGTVEQLAGMKEDFVEALSDWRQYRKIGTVEECRVARERQKGES